MTIQEVANRFHNLVSAGQSVEAQAELFANNVECIEPAHAPMPGTKGKKQVAERLQQWYGACEEMYSVEFSKPVVAGNHFTMAMKADMKMRGQERAQMEEVCVYKVENGQIVKEQYFY